MSGVVRAPLHGLPVSLKDCFKIVGTDGCTAFANQPTLACKETELTRIMRKSGAILFCKMNVPLALMSGEPCQTFNAIYGYTNNPYNRNLSSGGSFGGESALLALRRSSAWARILVARFFLDDGTVRPLPPVTRALLQTKALEKAGHTVIEYQIHDPLYLDGFKSALYRTATADALHKIISRMQEPWPRGYEGLARLVESSNSGGQGWDGERPEGPFEGCTTVSQLWEAQAKQTKFAKRMLTAWGETRPRTGTGREMDALLMPTSPWPASKRRVGNGSSGELDGILMQYSYRFQFSYDNYTSSYMKCTRLLRDDDSGHARLSLTADAKPEREAPSDLEARISPDCKSIPSAWHSCEAYTAELTQPSAGHFQQSQTSADVTLQS
ncbi:uracil-DNA glycosylase [Cordyceps militaris]|uniref:Uracil-DNA glycosylase n=1 Tax=Cordyceps militaris TaxID=73501 RepID=A0A2H4SAV2_CORMI|nr:uracil-DNA glycosylase [Cordyceps militaris]